MYTFDANLYYNKDGHLIADVPIPRLNRHYDPYSESSESHYMMTRPCIIQNQNECCVGYAIVELKEDINFENLRDSYAGTAKMAKTTIPDDEQLIPLMKYITGLKRAEMIIRKGTKMGDYVLLRPFVKNKDHNNKDDGYIIVQENYPANKPEVNFYETNFYNDDPSGTTEIMRVSEYVLRAQTGKTSKDFLGDTIVSHYAGTEMIEKRTFRNEKFKNILERAADLDIFNFYHFGNCRCMIVTNNDATKLPLLNQNFTEEERAILLDTVSQMNVVSNTYFSEKLRENPDAVIGKNVYGMDLIMTNTDNPIQLTKWLESHGW